MKNYKTKIIETGSYIFNSYFDMTNTGKRNSTYLFKQNDSGIYCRLNGYAIIPLEIYSDLSGENCKEMIKAANKDQKLIDKIIEPI